MKPDWTQVVTYFFSTCFVCIYWSQNIFKMTWQYIGWINICLWTILQYFQNIYHTILIVVMYCQKKKIQRGYINCVFFSLQNISYGLRFLRERELVFTRTCDHFFFFFCKSLLPFIAFLCAFWVPTYSKSFIKTPYHWKIGQRWYLREVIFDIKNSDVYCEKPSRTKCIFVILF